MFLTVIVMSWTWTTIRARKQNTHSKIGCSLSDCSSLFPLFSIAMCMFILCSKRSFINLEHVLSLFGQNKIMIFSSLSTRSQHLQFSLLKMAERFQLFKWYTRHTNKLEHGIFILLLWVWTRFSVLSKQRATWHSYTHLASGFLPLSRVLYRGCKNSIFFEFFRIYNLCCRWAILRATCTVCVPLYPVMT